MANKKKKVEDVIKGNAELQRNYEQEVENDG